VESLKIDNAKLYHANNSLERQLADNVERVKLWQARCLENEAKVHELIIATMQLYGSVFDYITFAASCPLNIVEFKSHAIVFAVFAVDVMIL
jgi:hypothetical protein